MTEVSSANAKATSLSFAFGIALVAFGLVFLSNFHRQFGIATFNIPVLLDHPRALLGFMAEAYGGSLLLPTLHLGFASMFKSKRNATSRRRIFIGWSVFIVGLTLLMLWLPK